VRDVDRHKLTYDVRINIIFIFRCLLIIAVNCEIHRFDYLCQTRSMTKNAQSMWGEIIFQFSRHLTWGIGELNCVSIKWGEFGIVLFEWKWIWVMWCWLDFEWCWLVIRGHLDCDGWGWPRGWSLGSFWILLDFFAQSLNEFAHF